MDARLEVGETVLLARRSLNELAWDSTDELERALRSMLGDAGWAFRWTEDGLWVSRREP